MKEFEVTVKLRNNLLKQRRLELGLTPKEIAAEIGMTYGQYLTMEALTYTPTRSKVGRASGAVWKLSALKVATFFGASPEELWPPTVRMVKSTQTSSVLSFEEIRPLLTADYEVLAQLPPPADQETETRELSRDIEALLVTLTPREQQVLQHRYGLNSRRPGGKTMAEVGDLLGVSGTRVDQIERAALRKLRHPSRARALVSHVAWAVSCPVCDRDSPGYGDPPEWVVEELRDKDIPKACSLCWAGFAYRYPTLSSIECAPPTKCPERYTRLAQELRKMLQED